VSTNSHRNTAPEPAAIPANAVKPGDLRHHLRSLHDGDGAVIEAIGIGAPAIPVLRELLFERDPSGIFEPRMRAVQALAALRAKNELKEFVREWKSASDPVERFGDEAVLGAAARFLGATMEEDVYDILMAIGRKHPVPGVIEALGRYGRSESVSIMLRALADDISRTAAEQALRILGEAGVPALIEAAMRPVANFWGREIPSSVRRRRSALMLLLEFGVARDTWDRIRRLVSDSDDEISVRACAIGLTVGTGSDQRDCAWRMVELLRSVVWPLHHEIEECLIDNFAIAREFVDQAIKGPTDDIADDFELARFKRSLRRIAARALTRQPPGS
jgi:HEAT repeat protein